MQLHIGDRFTLIVDVINQCFGHNYKAYYKGTYIVNPSKKVEAWFPKIADLSNGKPEPGDKWYGWCNTMSDDGNFIYMNNFKNPDLMNKGEACEEPHITFVKLPGEKQYQYAGVYYRTRHDKELGWVYERVATDIDLDRYL